MKKILVAFLILLLAGCGVDKEGSVIDEHIEIIGSYAEYASSDHESYIKSMNEFNEYLSNIVGKYEEYAQVQIEANEMRIKGIEENDNELFSDSAWVDAKARQILDDIRK